MNDGILKRKTPVPSLSISRKTALSAIVIIGVLITFAIVLGKRPSELKAATSDDSKASPDHSVTMLPSTYADLPPPKPEPPARIEYLERDSSNAELAKLLAQMAAEKQKRTLEARRASISFQGISVPQHGPIAQVESDDSTSSEAGHLNPRDTDNRQDEKMSFLDSKRARQTYLDQRIISPRSKYHLMAGTLIPGLLLTGLNSDLPGQIIGQVSQNVFDSTNGKYLLVPQGTKVLGQYDSRVVYGQERVLIVWNRLIFPNGRSISLEGMPGVDLSGYAGLSDQVNNHYLRLLTGVVFSSLLGAGAQVAEGRSYTSVNPQYSQLAVQGVAQNANEVGQEITRRNLNIQPTLEIRPGSRFNVFVHKDMVLEPYSS